MIEKLELILKMIVAILPFVILCIISNKVNIPKPERSKQFAMPGISIIYVIVVMILSNKINDWLLNLIKSIPLWIASLAGFDWMPEQIAAVFTQISSTIKTALQGLNLGFWIFFIANAVIIAGYLLLKRAVIAFLQKAVKSNSDLHSKVAVLFYDYFSEKDKWCVKDAYSQARTLLKVFYYSAIALSSILMLVSRELYEMKLFKTLFYPVFGIIIVGELFFYLDGLTRREYINDILGEDENAYRVVNYSLLRKFLRSIFGDKLLAENTSVNNSLGYDVTTEDILRELETNPDQKVVTFASYMSALNRTGLDIDHNYLYSSLDLLKGKSILFNNPFYNDLIPYAFYPMNRTLLSHQKVLIILGRHSIEEDIKEWVERGIGAITNIPFMWNVGVLGKKPADDVDIGIITRSDVLDIELHNANTQFLENVGFVVIIEPSKLISTAQIGLNLLVKKCRNTGDKNIVYCLCDKNCDGLVDAMSHALMTSITEVSATNKHKGTSSYMCWEADDEYLHHRLVPNISRYLGLGTELSFAALKNQVSKTKWFGGDAFPVTDIRWIDRQYYYDLNRYAGLPTTQEAIDESFITSPNYWSAQIEKNNYFTVEDESYNMFEILREFSTRSTEQGFINVISPEYLMKDYMADNASIFEADAKAVPYIVADYTRSNRNTILRLVLMMSTFEVTEKTLSKELSLLGISVFDLTAQLWFEIYNCYAGVEEIEELPDDYEQAVKLVSEKTLSVNGFVWTKELIKSSESFNFRSGELEITYAIADPNFLKNCVAELKSAGYVSEDEKGGRYYLGAELSGHIYQKYLPGQFFTFGGKYYEMQYLTADGQVLVRRAADHINSRQTYRQIRRYKIHSVKSSEKIGAHKNISGLKVISEYADISVETPAYYRMEKHNDFTTAKRIAFEGEKNGIPLRTYRNKEILRIELPDFDGKLNDSVRYTIAVMFNELFQTLFAENQAYICALTDDSFIGESDDPRPLTYSISGEGYELKPNCIYIVEDSQLDLGLTVAVERNLERIFKIIYDYLDWNAATLEKSLNPEVEPEAAIVFNNPEGTTPDDTPNDGSDDVDGVNVGDNKKKKGILDRFRHKKKKTDDKEEKGILGWLKRRKHKKKNPDGEIPFTEPIVTETDPIAPEEPIVTEPDPTAPEKPVTPDLSDEDGTESSQNTPEETKTPRQPENNCSDATDTPADSNTETSTQPADTAEMPGGSSINLSNSDNVVSHGIVSPRKPYHERYYMLFGKDGESSFIDLRATLNYLNDLGMERNPLKQARESKNIARLIESTFKPGKPDARYCDFCGCEIFGVEYETLADGRDRCLSCGRTAIKTEEEFRKLFEDAKRNMESFFGIRINTGISVRMVNSKKLHSSLGKAFVPSDDFDGRVLGVAIKEKHGGYTLMIESGSPRMSSMLTMVHELTHIWQYLNWNDKAIVDKYGKDMRLEIYEGMAKWVEIQYAYLINEPAVAKREEIITAYREDPYGWGFLRYRENYPFSTGTVITRPTPFMDTETPLDPQYCGTITVRMPTNGANPVPDDEDKPHTPSVPKLPTQPIDGTIERKPGEVAPFAYNRLSDDEKAVYDVILEAIINFVEELTEFPASITHDRMQVITNYIQRDHPEVFWFQHGSTFHFESDTKIVTKIDLAYCVSKDEAEKRKQKIDVAIKPFLTAVNNNMCDYEVALRIYENIIKLVDYDTIGLERQKKLNTSDDGPDDLRSIYGVFVDKKAVCVGYAKATQYLLNMFGIECTLVTSDTHAWNLIKLEGDYYHLDTTWGDGSDTKKDKNQTSSISYDCFCITTKELLELESHVPEDILPIPECTATKCNYHRRHGLYFDSFNYDRIRSIVCESINGNKFDISFKFASSTAYEDAKRELLSGGKFREAIQYSNLKSETRVDSTFVYCTADDRRTLAFYLTKL